MTEQSGMIASAIIEAAGSIGMTGEVGTEKGVEALVDETMASTAESGMHAEVATKGEIESTNGVEMKVDRSPASRREVV